MYANAGLQLKCLHRSNTFSHNGHLYLCNIDLSKNRQRPFYFIEHLRILVNDDKVVYIFVKLILHNNCNVFTPQNVLDEHTHVHM